MNNTQLNSPLVSIVLPTYNRAYVLPQAIHSVLNQTYKNLELIIVDDNSPDNTSEIVKSFNDSRIRYLRNDPNLKLPRALNKGFSVAQGDLLTWTSDDNLFDENAIEKMVEYLTTEHCNFVYADYYLFSDLDDNGKPLDISHDHLPDQIQLEKGNHIGACFMYTRLVYEKIGEYDPELFLVEDYDYFIRISKHFRSGHIAEPLYYFRRDENTLYCSRFCEVKASDFLVRYKNSLLDETAVLDAMINLIMGNIEGLKNPLLRRLYPVIHKRSFRLTQLFNSFTARYLKYKLAKPVHHFLNQYSSKHATFKETRDELKNLLQSLATIEYGL